MRWIIYWLINGLIYLFIYLRTKVSWTLFCLGYYSRAFERRSYGLPNPNLLFMIMTFILKEDNRHINCFILGARFVWILKLSSFSFFHVSSAVLERDCIYRGLYIYFVFWWRIQMKLETEESSNTFSPLRSRTSLGK
jgi:hypothetical protein